MRQSLTLLVFMLLTAMLGGCNPHYNWRDYRSADAPYTVLFPAKPATHTRAVQLGAITVNMTMTAAEIDGVVFAVGSAELTDAAQAPAALQAMQTALAHNIGASISGHAVATAGRQTTVSIEAHGMRQGQPALLIGRFVAQDKRIYQVIVMGAERDILREHAETFMQSFKPT